MDITVDALKNVYVSLGGNIADVEEITLIPDMINAIATVAAGATSSELPSVKSADNGKVLTVVSGKWAAAALPE